MNLFRNYNKSFSRFVVSKRILLIIAGIVWAIAGSILFRKGVVASKEQLSITLRVLIGIIGGSFFYKLLFSRISLRLISRIISLPEEKNFVLSFFNYRGYLMMGLMISLGVLVSHSKFVSPEALAVFDIFMGTPLLISAIRFMYYGYTYKTMATKSRD